MIANVVGVAAHPFKVGVTVTVETIGVFVEFVPVNDGMFPEPLAAKPVAVLSFVQLYVVAEPEPTAKTDISSI